jgi:hypothetical protein
MSNPNIKDLMRLEYWREKRASHLFKTESSLQWFIRTNKQRLIESGAFIAGNGRRPSLVDAERMDDEVVSIYVEGNGDSAA